MQRTDLSFQQIYNQLLAGKRLVLHFLNKGEAETFRTRLHHQKQKQERTFFGLGLQVEEERTVLSFKVRGADDSEEVVAYVQFALPSPLKKYPVVIIEDADVKAEVEENGAQVSAALG